MIRAYIFVVRKLRLIAVLTKHCADNKIRNEILKSSARLCRSRCSGFRGIIDNRVKDPGGTAAVSAEERRRMKIGHWG